jgi:hypothetical protein
VWSVFELCLDSQGEAPIGDRGCSENVLFRDLLLASGIKKITTSNFQCENQLDGPCRRTKRKQPRDGCLNSKETELLPLDQ